MADGVSFGPDNIEKRIEPAEEPASGKKGIGLYKSPRFEVFVPAKSNVPLNEGLHIQISDGHNSKDSAREILSRYALALGSAKALAESGLTQDAWANTRLEKGQAISVYGRIPGNEKSWRKPVDTFSRNVPEINRLEPNYNTAKLQKLFSRYLPKWEKITESIELFKNGVKGKDIKGQSSQEEVSIWENDKFNLVIVTKPHLKGIHLVVNPKESVRRQWQTAREEEQIYIQQTLEATAIAMGVQKLLAPGQGEIHNSGNWAGDLKSTEEGGRLNMQNFKKNRKTEKKIHRPDIASEENQIRTGMHAHIYIPEDGPVVLPEMSKEEAIEKGRADIARQWDEIPPTNAAQLEEIKTKLGKEKLTKWLDENCKGQLINKAT